MSINTSINKFATFTDIQVDWKGQGNPTIRVWGLDMRLPERFLTAVDENGLNPDRLSPRLRRDLDILIEGFQYHAHSRKKISALDKDGMLLELGEAAKKLIDFDVQATNPKTCMNHEKSKPSRATTNVGLGREKQQGLDENVNSPETKHLERHLDRNFRKLLASAGAGWLAP